MGSTSTHKPSNRKESNKSVGTSTERNLGPLEVSNYSTIVLKSSDVYLYVILVKVSAENKLIYALLDQGSTATLRYKRLLSISWKFGRKAGYHQHFDN